MYSVDPGAGEKRTIADRLVEESIRNGSARASAQVVAEWLHVVYVRHRYLDRKGVESYLSLIFEPMLLGEPTARAYLDAIRLKERYGISIWDAIVLADARAAHCAVMFSEDLQHGQIYDGVRVLNPFLS